MDPFHDLYFNNIIELITNYYFAQSWAIGISGGYMWTHLEEREAFLRIPYESWEEP